MFKSVFTILMWLGLSIALYMALGPVFALEWRPNLLLKVSIGHMISLSIIAWIIVLFKKGDNIEIGSRLGTTGYLHTLIGTCAALIAASSFDGNNANEIQQIIKPIGAALGTSIIGWWMGKEIQVWSTKKETKETSSDEEVDQAFRKLASSVRKLSDKLDTSGDKWETSVNQLGDKINKTEQKIGDINRNLTTIVSTSATLSKSLSNAGSNMKSAVKASSNIASEMQTLADEAKSTATQLNKTNESLKNVNKIIAEADKLLALLRRERTS